MAVLAGVFVWLVGEWTWRRRRGRSPDGRRLDLAAAPRGVGNGGGQLDGLAFLFSFSVLQAARADIVCPFVSMARGASGSFGVRCPACLPGPGRVDAGLDIFHGHAQKEKVWPRRGVLFFAVSLFCSPPPFLLRSTLLQNTNKNTRRKLKFSVFL
jgi:hypothetical protein